MVRTMVKTRDIYIDETDEVVVDGATTDGNISIISGGTKMATAASTNKRRE